ncbi:MAG: hypothetical protein HY473_01790 [Candidatus Sungbacteria bacterium]|uniref:DUF5667 domain-containing protein n=1 Tax=Candidatus Sungiibacteriota bacterium TaxID=2750080 RepID=A0A932YZ03_9BACT|nr:hypothetical protein [Candidatus Sungbacteria bacterium]
MSSEFEKFFRPAREVRLTPGERVSMRHALEAFMKIRPAVRMGLNGRLIGIRRMPTFFSGFFLKPMPLALLIAGLIAATSGVSFAAEGALPGDFLYPMKVSVNEEVRGALAISPAAGVRWEVRRLERRLEEAEALAKNASLSSDTRADIEKNFDAHADRIQARILEIESAGRIESAAELGSYAEASLRAHEQILVELFLRPTETPRAAGIEFQTESARSEVNKLRIKVRERKRDLALLRFEAEGKVSSRGEVEVAQAAAGRLAAAEAKIKEVRAFLERTRSRLGVETAAAAETRLAIAEHAVLEGRAKLDAGLEGEAFALFQRAHRIAQEAKLLASAAQSLKLDISISGNGTSTSAITADDADEESGRHNGDDDGDDSVDREDDAPLTAKKISTAFGTLWLERIDGRTVLRGTLSRPTPCANWRVTIASTKDNPPSGIGFAVEQEDTGEICIQVLGTPQEVRVETRAATHARYTVRIHGQVVFSGTLSPDDERSGNESREQPESRSGEENGEAGVGVDAKFRIPTLPPISNGRP